MANIPVVHIGSDGEIEIQPEPQVVTNIQPIAKKKVSIIKRKSPKTTASLNGIIATDTNETINTQEQKTKVANMKVIKETKRGVKKIKQTSDASYLRIPELNESKITDFGIKSNKDIDNAVIKLQNKIKAMHQVLWEAERMDGEQALDEIMKLIFLRYISRLASKKEEPNKIDLLNPKHHTTLLQENDGDDDFMKNYDTATNYLLDFTKIWTDIEDNNKNGKLETFLKDLWKPVGECSIFGTMASILNCHSTTKGIYNANIFSIKHVETLKELIKHICSDIFDTTHEIEDLIGEIYEYFLNKYNKKRSALGQYFTPRMLMNITIKYLVERIHKILTKFPDPVVSDKCMGTGGWLVKVFNSFKDINKNILLHGKEFKPNTYQYGIINLISTTGNFPYHPSMGCSLTNVEDIALHLIFSNPPFNGKFDYDKLKKEYEKNKKPGINTPKFKDIYFLDGEDNTPLQFLQLYIHLLEEGGLCAIVIPYGELFFKDGKSMNAVRSVLLDKINITDIILCPPGIFTHTDVKVCMLVFEKNKSGTKEIKFSRFRFDKTETILDSIEHITTVKKEDILKEPIHSFYHMDYLHDGFVVDLQKKMPKYDWVPFGDMFDLIKGDIPSGKVVETEQEFDGIEFVKFITGAKDESWKIINVNKNISYCEGENVFISENGNGNCRPIKYYNGNCNYSNLVSLLKCKKNYENKINKKYIYYYLKNIQSMIEEQYQKGSCNQSLDVKNFNRMKIPIPPMETQFKLISENSNYDKKIEELKSQLIIIEEKKNKNTMEFLNKYST
jgi:type I restriction-modification system DNA methylase subunit